MRLHRVSRDDASRCPVQGGEPMRSKLQWMAVLALGFLVVHAIAEQTTVLKTSKEKMSYAIGVQMARNLKRMEVDVAPDVLTKAMRDVLSGETLLMSDEDLRLAISSYQAGLRQRQAKALKTAAENNRKEGDAFLEANKAKQGVVTLPSGLQYKVLEAGDGKKPTEADTVECRYRGTLINGTEFDSSHGQPATFKVPGVIPGWREALRLIPVGSKWQLFIPPHLAYAERGAGRDIGPNATLIFELEILAVK